MNNVLDRPPVPAHSPAAGLGSPSHVLTPAGGAAQVRSWQGGYARLLLLTDVLSIAAALITARLVRFTPELWPTAEPSVYESLPQLLPWAAADQWVVSGLLLVAWVMMMGAVGTRDRRIFGSGPAEYRRVIHATFWVFGLLAIAAFAADWQISRGYLLIAMPLGLLLLLATRYAWRSWLVRRRRTGRWAHRAVIAGEAAKVAHTQEQISRLGDSAGLAVIETITDCSVERILDTVTSSGADMVILTGSDILGPQAMRELGWELSALDVDLVVAPSLTDVAGPRIHSLPVAGVPLMRVDYPRLTGRAALLKRCFDIVFSLTVLILLAPLLAATALAVKWDSPGPVFFHQQRVGLNHTRFTMVKFRSMVVDAEAKKQSLLAKSEGNGVLFKMKSDPRVTRVGRTLRRCSLDELPQFFNVLRGEMSVVGPRPPLAAEVEEYDDASYRRLLVKPGITGLWQVAGRSDLSWEDSVRLDLYYVENWSLTTDIGLVLRTLRVVVTGAGAY